MTDLDKKVSPKIAMLMGFVLLIVAVGLFYLAIMFLFEAVGSKGESMIWAVWAAFILGILASSSGLFFLLSGFVSFIRKK